ncbi:hypothetical protein [Colwellia hornerae]|uniref:Uncharacterized protein n=1 Tax=Colwellia hornerae TaxID=89402 RepID=A0A5C6Q885_9GAMM|nr:hypothetical protein [Colwellia hornerae]TWX57785.1 hypothetical protein ESZ28_03500 [Colwellia hornerae]TWX62484.1 hypothetical protein ESZ26_01185 [Colwellia hornerae]TWX65043.1 hypothetical protein ESZ27_13050 [Colwellia hornerae]
MYQDKIEQKVKTAIASNVYTENRFNVFEYTLLEPLTFTAYEFACDATHLARDILSKRTNEDVVILSKAIDSMLKLGNGLLNELSLTLLNEKSTRQSVTLSKGRALYLLCDYFDLNTIDIKNLQWCEIFATLTLMHSAEIKFTYDNRLKEDALSLLLKEQVGDEQFSIMQQASLDRAIRDLLEEIIDSIARAECLFDKKSASSLIAKAGGEGKAKNIEPLKIEVIERYLKSYAHFNKKKAGRAIEQELTIEDHPLLLLSYSEDKDLQFSKWIGSFLNGSYKFPFNK